MSVWAQSWAYEQRAGSPGAKAVLVALSCFADEAGYCYPSQETIAGMTEQTERTVRTHIVTLEASGLIRRNRRRRPDGTWLSDAFYLLAPPERLRPHIPKPEEPLRQVLPVEDFADGRKPHDQRNKTSQPAEKNVTDQRKNLPANSQDKPSIEPSIEPSTSAHRRTREDAVFADVLEASGTDPASLTPATRTRQLAVARQLLDDGYGPEKILACFRYLRSQSWRRKPPTLATVRTDISDWEAAGCPERELARGSPVGKNGDGPAPSLSAYVVPEDELTPAERAFRSASREEKAKGFPAFLEKFQASEVAR